MNEKKRDEIELQNCVSEAATGVIIENCHPGPKSEQGRFRRIVRIMYLIAMFVVIPLIWLFSFRKHFQRHHLFAVCTGAIVSFALLGVNLGINWNYFGHSESIKYETAKINAVSSHTIKLTTCLLLLCTIMVVFGVGKRNMLISGVATLAILAVISMIPVLSFPKEKPGTLAVYRTVMQIGFFLIIGLFVTVALLCTTKEVNAADTQKSRLSHIFSAQKDHEKDAAINTAAAASLDFL